MKNKKNAGIETLNEILLRMSYDVNKTLSENIIIITEQMTPKGPYYTPAGELTDKPGRFTSPTTTTNIAASRVYPEIKDNKYPQKADFNKLNLAFTGRRLGTLSQQSSKIPTQKSSSFTPPDTRSYQDATYVSPQNLMGSGPPKPKDVPTFNTPNNVTYQDATYVSPQYAGIKDPELIKIAKKWEEEKESTRPIPPKSEVIMYDPNQYPKPTPKWIYKGVKYTNKKDADSKYEIDKKEWIKKYGEGFEQWVARNGDTIHTILGYGALALAIVSMAAATVLTGGLALPAVGLSLEGVAGAASLLLTAADSGLYAYEGNTRMAVFVGLLGIFDVAQILKAVKGIKVLESEIKLIRKKAIDNSTRLTNGQSKLKDVFTEREIQILKSIDPAVIRGDIKITAKAALKEAVKELGFFMVKSPKYFASSLLKLKNYGLLGKLFLVVDGIQLSYNFIYNGLTSEDEKLQSMTLLLIEYIFTKQETKTQIENNNKIIEDTIISMPEETSAEIMASTTGLDIGVNVTNKESLTSVAERLEQKLSEIKTKYGKLNDNEKKILPGAVKTYNNITGSVPFKNIEVGNKFREWFNDEYPILSKDISLDREGPYNNTFIKRAYNIPMGDGRIVGDIYNDYKEIENINKKDEYVGSSSDMG